METIKIGNNILEYDDSGSGKVILLLSGWCQDHRLFKHIVEDLRSNYRVIRLNWRGHNSTQSYDGDFGVKDQIEDVIKFLDTMNISEVYPVSTSHGGWANIGLSDYLGKLKVPKVIVIDWLMQSAFTDLMNNLRDSQIPSKWEAARNYLFNEWVSNTDNKDIVDHVWKEMASFNKDMWVRSCREIEHAYRQWSSPLERISAMEERRPVAHIYSQPISAEYDSLQRNFNTSNSWYCPIKIEGKTHFPTLESPKEVVEAIQRFIG